MTESVDSHIDTSTDMNEALVNHANYYKELASMLPRVSDPVLRAELAANWMHRLESWAGLMRRARNDAVIEALNAGEPAQRVATRLGVSRQGVKKIYDGHD